jgi:ribonucleoside-diphosphate reductase alpha chain
MDNVDVDQKTNLLGKEGLKIHRFFTKPGENVFEKVEWETRTSSIKNPDGTVVFEMQNVEVPKFWSQVATDILAQKNMRKRGVPQVDKDGNQMTDEFGKSILGSETSLKQVVKRLVGCWRYWGEKYNYFASREDAQAFEDELVYMLIYQMAAPNSPQWYNTGLNWAYGIEGPSQGHWYVDPGSKQLVQAKDAYTHPQVHACFIQAIKDDLVNDGGILDMLQKEARIFKYGSGSGINFSTIRAEGEPLSGGGKSSGVMSFLKIFDANAGAIKSGGTTRRASKIVILNIDHPDIEKFISWKSNEEKKVAALVAAGYSNDFEGDAYTTVSGQNSNNSVRVTDEFIKSVIEDSDWNLRWRTNGKIIRTVKARNLWDQIANASWTCADPGLQFDTTINDWNTCSASGRINASNPCSEFMFLDNTACNLASINLRRFLDSDTAIFDVDGFKHACRLWTIVLEISVLMAGYPSHDIADLSYKFRSLGLGYTNLGSMLIVAGIPYDSDQARTIAAAITAILTGEVYATSAEIASVMEPFPEFEKNKEHMLKVIKNHRRVVYNAKAEEYEKIFTIPEGIDHKVCPEYLLSAAIESWDRALTLGQKYGYRNAQATLLAPTGTISLVLDCDTTGIEPDFALVKFKKLVGGGYLKLINQSVIPAFKRLGYSDTQIKDIVNYAIGTGSLVGSPYINASSLKEKGFDEAAIAKIEKALPFVLELQFAFSSSVLGKATLEELGYSEEEFSKPNFNLLKALGFTENEIEAANEYVCGTMTVEGAPHMRDEDLAIFDCANKCGKNGKRYIDYMAHVKTMAAVQPLLSGSISKTVNMPNEATVDDVKRVYFESWRRGLKSIALYRDGCKLSQPLSTVMSHEEEVKQLLPKRKRLPAERSAITHKFRVGNQEGYITVGLFDDGTPGELFVTMSKEGSTLSGLMGSFALTVSIALQYGVPLKALVTKLTHTRYEPSGWTDNPQIQVAKSLTDYIARWLALKFLPKEDLADIGLNGFPNLESIPSPSKIISSSKLEEQKNLEEFKEERQADSDAPTCDLCGSLMTRSGTCYLCTNCGSTTGCS